MTSAGVVLTAFSGLMAASEILGRPILLDLCALDVMLTVKSFAKRLLGRGRRNNERADMTNEEEYDELASEAALRKAPVIFKKSESPRWSACQSLHHQFAEGMTLR